MEYILNGFFHVYEVEIVNHCKPIKNPHKPTTKPLKSKVYY